MQVNFSKCEYELTDVFTGEKQRVDFGEVLDAITVAYSDPDTQYTALELLAAGRPLKMPYGDYVMASIA